MANIAPRAQPPVVSVYQNPEHVAGLLQQLLGQPLVTTETKEKDREDSSAKKKTSQLSGKADAKASAAALANASLGGAGGVSNDEATTLATSTRTSQSFVYSQAYYLNIVRSALRTQGFIHEIKSLKSAQELHLGDFVEFTASFSPSTIPAIMDVITPNLVAGIVEWRTRKAGRDGIDYSKFAEVQAHSAELDMKAKADAQLAREVTEAVKLDFRQEKTREYYGAIRGIAELTLVTICDSAHFVVEDEDRILDGSYTVLGKITSELEEDLPVLQRNKLLRNVSPDAADKVMSFMQEQLNSTGASKIGDTDIDELLEVNLSSRVPGAALRVIPIAIFI